MTDRSPVPKVVALCGALLLAACTTPISVTGPCEVASNEEITLEVSWLAAAQPDVATSRSVRADRTRAPRVEADGESMLIMIDVPTGWTVQTATWSGTINGEAADGTAEVLETAPYCGGSFLALREGYTRSFFRINPGVEMTTDSHGVLQATYATGTLSEGVYHPLVMGTVESELCTLGTAFHRVTVGAPQFVQFDLTPHLNADVVVNGEDSEQDPLLVTDEGSFAYVTRSFLDGAGGTNPALPDDGVLRGTTMQDLAAGQSFPIEIAECMPPFPTAISDASDGDNAWAGSAGEALTISVPARRYAEILLVVSGGISPPGSGDGLMTSEIDVTLTYDDSTASTQRVVLPPAGTWGIVTPEPATPVIPIFAIEASTAVVIPFDAGAETGAGILDAVALTPDPSKRLVSVTVRAATSPEASAILEQKLALFAAAGMALAEPFDLAATKQVLTTGTISVGDPVTWRITVRNEGGSSSAAVTLTDVLPAQFQYTSVSASDGTCSQLAGTVTCNLGVLAAGASETVDIAGRITAPGPVANTAAVSAAGETNLANNSGSSTVNALPAAAAIPTLSHLLALVLAALLGMAALTRLN